jgi:predicted nucleotidyltransferase
MLEPSSPSQRRSPRVPVDHNVLQGMAAVIAHASGASKVILFGSAARGQAHADSDLDWLLVIPDEHFGSSFMTQIQPALRASQALMEQELYVCAMDFLPIRSSSYESGQTAIARDAALHGKVLHG